MNGAESASAEGDLLYRQEAGSAVQDAQFDPTGRRVAIATSNGEVLKWDPGESSAAHAIVHHAGRVNSVSFSPDGKRLVTASEDHTARIWDANNGQPLIPALRHEGPVSSAASTDGTARVWNVSPTSADLEALMDHARLFSAHRLAENNTTVPLDIKEMERLWEANRAREH